MIAAGLSANPEIAKADEPATPLEELPEGDSVILRMQRELRRALARPVEKRRWVMVIDLRKCIGCSACTIGCVAENKLPPGVVYRPVMEEEIGEYPNVTRRFLPRLCNQCDNPPCVPVAIAPASAAITNAAASVTMWPASLNKASEPDHQPTAASTPAKPSVKTVASMSLRPFAGFLHWISLEISRHLGTSELRQCRGAPKCAAYEVHADI